ncbi:MAG: MetQ/NlpA family ABC transporter substrate-binding protein [Oscillospiraceae bacterium]|nr:MetQ/NlpA family ABC transporter substrate-binding protein [Oscillospiraceae bacterium]
MRKFIQKIVRGITCILCFALLVPITMSLSSCHHPTQSPEEQPEGSKIGVGVSGHYSGFHYSGIMEICRQELEKRGSGLQARIYPRSQDVINALLAQNDTHPLDISFAMTQQDFDNIQENNGQLVSLGRVGFVCFSAFAGRIDSIEELTSKSRIVIPRDEHGRGRALLLLSNLGLIELKANTGLNAGLKDINKKRYDFLIDQEDVAQMSAEDTLALRDNADIIVMNGLAVAADAFEEGDWQAIASESPDSSAAQQYADIIVVREGEQKRQDVQAFLQAMQSVDMRENLLIAFKGGYIPLL